MSTATVTPDVVPTDSTAIVTKKTSSKVQKKPAGRKPTPTSCLGFSNKKGLDVFAASAKAQYESVANYVFRTDISLDDIYLCAEHHHKSGATVIAIATAGYMWLTEGAMLTAMYQRVKSAGNDWQKYYEECLRDIFGGKSIRSEQMCRKMYDNHQKAFKQDPEMVERAINENGKVNDLAGALKTIATGGDPFRSPTAEETATLQAKKVEAVKQRPNKLAEQLQKLLQEQGYSEALQDQFDDFIKAMQTDKVDPNVVNKSNNVDIPEPFTMEGLERRHGKPLTNLVMS